LKETFKGFVDEYRFLSNFYEMPFFVDNIMYKTVEHFYQSQKTHNNKEKKRIIEAHSPFFAKKYGMCCTLRKDWEDVKTDVMYKGLCAKFSQNSVLCVWLRNTEDTRLVEYNHWGDTYWGVDFELGGKNVLGRLLMDIRQDTTILRKVSVSNLS